LPDSFVVWKAGAFAAVFLRGKSFRLKGGGKTAETEWEDGSAPDAKGNDRDVRLRQGAARRTGRPVFSGRTV